MRPPLKNRAKAVARSETGTQRVYAEATAGDTAASEAPKPKRNASIEIKFHAAPHKAVNNDQPAIPAATILHAPYVSASEPHGV
jgi:hypothetical protein